MSNTIKPLNDKFNTMKINKFIFFIFFPFFKINLGNADINSDTAISGAGATVITPITIVTTANLLFGSVEPTNVAGTVTVSPGGGRSSTNVVLSSMALGSPASFYLSGNPGFGFSIVLPSSVTLTGPGASMQLSQFTSTPSSTGSLNASGNTTINVGGTLAIGANQAAGTYSGNFSITVNYY